MRFTKYLVLIGIILFLFILYSVGPLEILQIILKLDPYYFFLALVVLFSSILFKGYKQKVLLMPMKARIAVFESTKIWLIGSFFGMFTPAKAGDFFRAVYLKKSAGLPLGKGIAATAVERILDLGYLFLAGVVGLIIFTVHFSLDFSILVSLLAFLAFFLAGVFIMTRKKWVSFLLKPVFRFFLPEKHRQNLAGSFDDFYAAIRQFMAAKKIAAFAVFLTVVAWFIVVLQYYFILLSLNIWIPLEFLVWVIPVILLIEVLPISFAGIGTRDATSIFFFAFVGITASQAVSFSLVVLFLNILTALFGLIFLNQFDLGKGLDK